jgi:cysteine synthase A
LFLGSSAAVNCVGAVKAAMMLGPGHTVVTVLCDGGARHLSKFHSPSYLAEMGLTPEATGSGLEWVREA